MRTSRGLVGSVFQDTVVSKNYYKNNCIGAIYLKGLGVCFGSINKNKRILQRMSTFKTYKNCIGQQQ